MKIRIVHSLLLTGLLTLTASLQGNDELRVPNIFGHSMVLQAGTPITVWGWAAKGAPVEVSIGAISVQAHANETGIWSVRFPKLAKTFQPRELRITSGSASIVFRDILIGEVWVCGGQSNMAWTLKGSRDGELEIASADTPQIRFIRVPLISRGQPQTDFEVTSPTADEGNWRKAMPDQVDNCTAVGYYFAQRISRLLKSPVGLVDTSWGGTMAQHWVTKETLANIPEMQPYQKAYENALKVWTDGGEESGASKRYAVALTEWEREAQIAKRKGDREPRRPNQNDFINPGHKRHPAGMINGMIYPISKLSIRGVLFYQGENNSFGTSWKPFYATYPAVIHDWRRLFNTPTLPFGLVQIAGWSNRRSMTYDMNHHTNVIREIQHITWRQIPHTGLITTYDTNSNGNIHPAHKRPVGERLARWALNEVYQKQLANPIQWMGPVFKDSTVEDGKIIIGFMDGTANGLRLDKDLAAGFYIAGDDQVFRQAAARILGSENKLVVWHDEIAEPKAVRYGFSNLPHGTLLNGKELPAYPFRTDTWKMTPHQSTGDYDILTIRAFQTPGHETDDRANP
ncbi:MAG: hypothetical protein CMJ76_10795 [Planctomycetaceae bacterium]|nr:hypothetical protein [Planctomycetaceae bacterium]